ncbi:MAG: hypothetical protein R3F17_01485 [Planctomycetota bacterium]
MEVHVFDGNSMRVQITDRASGAYRRGVDVRVLGSGNARMESAETDPVAWSRSVRSPGCLRSSHEMGTTTRSTWERSSPPRKDVPAQQDKFKNIDSVLLLENFYSGNTINIEERSKQVDEQMRKDRRGVQVQSVK